MTSSSNSKPRLNKPVKPRVSKKKDESNRIGKSKSKIIGVFVALMLLVTAGRLFYIQVLTSDQVASKAMDSRTRTMEIAAKRGDILDKDGRILTSSVNRYDLVVDQRLVKDYKVWSNEKNTMIPKDVKEEINNLSKIIDKSYNELEESMIGDKPYKIVIENITPETKDKAMELKIPGLIANRISDRQYPNGNMAGSIIGILGKEGKPLAGLELSQDEKLSGTPGKIKLEMSADGLRIPSAPIEETPAVNGNSVKTTIDSDIQWFAQKKVEEKAEETESEWASVIILDAKTGQIRAMADSQSLDPTDISKTDSKFWRPMSVTEPYEPGSTGKAVTIAAAMEKGKIKATDSFTVPNQMKFDGQTIRDATRHDTHEMTVAGIFSMSSNTGTIQIAEKISDKEKFEMMKKFGIGDTINIGMPYSTSGFLSNPDSWDGRTKFTTSFGQGYSQTMLHTAQIYQAIVNDGVLKHPSLIDSYIAPNGTEVKYELPEDRRVISSDTSKEMRRLLESVVTNGISSGAKIPGYRVGGKSGTAEVVGEDGRYDGYAVSFAGVYPIDDPQYVIVSAVYRPKSWMGNFVDSMTSEIGAFALQKSGVAPKKSNPDVIDTYSDGSPNNKKY